MQRQMLSGKIHRGRVTDACVDYEGSITIDAEIMDAANILDSEKVLIANLTNGARIESYAMRGEAGSKMICLNGGAAKHGKVGDIVIIMTFAVLSEEEVKVHRPRKIVLDEKNEIISRTG
ncbi:MAG: aspartate 1-decarboxylase [Candidatus Omnitrophica bacterium]|nr:aspartate 1-decarboxylase [Candidatus Omnitrophota bacterium]